MCDDITYDTLDQSREGLGGVGPCIDEPSTARSDDWGRLYDSCHRVPYGPILKALGLKWVKISDFGTNFNCRGTPDYANSYSTFSLIESNPERAIAPDYLAYDITVDGRMASALDGTVQVPALMPAVLDNESIMGAAPLLPGPSQEPAIIEGHKVLKVDLNAQTDWSLLQLRSEVLRRYNAVNHDYVEVVPLGTRLDGCYRMSESDQWRNVQRFDAKEVPRGTRIYVQVHLSVWQDTDQQRGLLSEDICVQPHGHSRPAQILDGGERLEMHAYQPLTILARTSAARGGDAVAVRELTTSEYGVIEFDFTTGSDASFTISAPASSPTTSASSR